MTEAMRLLSISTDWLEARSRWSSLRELGQSNLVKASVLMPVFGYLLLLNDQVHQFLVNRFDAGWPFSHLPTLWRIWMLFYGTFLLAMGSLAFAAWCPREIKRYGSAFDLVDTERPHLTAQNQTQHIASKLAELYGRMSNWENSIFALPRLKPSEPNLGVGTPTGLASGDQWGLGLIHIWTIYDLKHPKLRICVLMMFSAGLFLLGLPALFTIVQVTFLLATRLLARM